MTKKDKNNDKKSEEKEEKKENDDEGTENDDEESGDTKQSDQADSEDSCPGCTVNERGLHLVNQSTEFEKKLGDDLYEGIHKYSVCPKSAINELAKVPAKLVDSVSSSIKNLGHSVSSAVNDLVNVSYGRHINGYPNIFGPFELVYALGVDKVQGVINSIVLGPSAEFIISNNNLDMLRQKIDERNVLYGKLLHDPSFNAVFSKWMSDYTEHILTTINIAKPEIDKIKKEIKDTIEHFGDDIGRTLSHAAVNVIKTAVANVPVIGGIVHSIISVDTLVRDIEDVCTGPIGLGAGVISKGVNAVKREECKLNEKLNELNKKTNKIVNRVENSINKTVQSGGRKSHKKNIKKIKNTTQRIKYMLNRFNRKTKCHIKKLRNKKNTRRL